VQIAEQHVAEHDDVFARSLPNLRQRHVHQASFRQLLQDLLVGDVELQRRGDLAELDGLFDVQPGGLDPGYSCRAHGLKKQ
jgi:hypothetical protein